MFQSNDCDVTIRMMYANMLFYLSTLLVEKYLPKDNDFLKHYPNWTRPYRVTTSSWSHKQTIIVCLNV